VLWLTVGCVTAVAGALAVRVVGNTRRSRRDRPAAVLAGALDDIRNGA
jgi:hypothetical protein